jgi:heptosyltransferase-2
MKIGVLLPNWIGDVVMATPTLRAIRRHFGSGAEIAGIMRPYVSKVLDGTSWLDRSFLFDRKSADPELRSAALLRQLRRWQPDTMVLLPNSFWAAAIAWLSGARWRIGYARNARGFLLTTRIEPVKKNGRQRPVSAIDHYLQLAYGMGCGPESPQLELGTRADDEARVDEVWRDLDLDKAERIVVFNTGSAVGSARSWPVDRYVRLALRLVDDPLTAVLVICGPQERATAASIEQLADHRRVRSMADQDLSLGVAKACVKRSNLMVTTDSGPRHFAPAFDVPSITLSGPIDPRTSASHHRRSIVVQHSVECGPCGKTTCPFAHHLCMSGITVEQVLAAVKRLLSPAPVPRREVLAASCAV